MTWLYLSILAAFLWSTVNVVYKIIVSRLVSNPRIPVLVNAFVKMTIGAVIVLVTRVSLTPWQLTVAVGGGAAYLVGSLFYFQAMQREEASRVVPVFALWIIWAVIAAAIFFQEIFSVDIYLGILAIILGSFLVLWRPNSGLLFAGKAALYPAYCQRGGLDCIQLPMTL